MKMKFLLPIEKVFLIDKWKKSNCTIIYVRFLAQLSVGEGLGMRRWPLHRKAWAGWTLGLGWCRAGAGVWARARARDCEGTASGREDMRRAPGWASRAAAARGGARGRRVRGGGGSSDGRGRGAVQIQTDARDLPEAG